MNDRIDGELRAGVPASLRLWLAGYHTPSLNVTTGKHWKVYLGLKQQAARALCDALRSTQVASKVLLLLDALAKGGRMGKRGELVRAAAKQEAERSRKAAVADRFILRSAATENGSVRAPVVLTFTRVTCRPLDVENHCGSTKALTDCLRLAFPDLLPDDAPEFVEIVHRQVKCAKRCEEGTWVELSRLAEREERNDE